jgi:NAD(P)-dependent dehydrogenase (short-subunit alcohol dehydrogenase family)
MGKAFAKALLAERMTVYAAARRLEQMSDLAALGAVTLKMDVTREEQIQAAVQRIAQGHGGADVLINVRYGAPDSAVVAVNARKGCRQDHQYLFYGWQDLHAAW